VAKQWWKKFVGFLTKHVNFRKSLWILVYYTRRKTKTKYFYAYTLMMYFHFKKFVHNLQNRENYSIKEIGKLDEYIGYKIKKGINALYIYQPDLINKMETQFNPLN
jgi:hypothetical protein